MTTATLFDQLCSQLHAEPDGRGEVWIDCPACGKDGKHCSFNEATGHCFVCGASWSLRQLARVLDVAADAPVAPRRVPPPRAPRAWQERPEYYLDRYGAAFDRLDRWQAYKPLSMDAIAHYRLGVGVLPASRCQHRRLILPLFDAAGRCVAIHGRAYLPSDTDAKWLSAGGSDKSVLFTTAPLAAGCTVVVCENYVDAIVAADYAPGAVYAACGGATWRPEWTAQLAAARVGRVLVWLDHDLAGNGSRHHHAELLALWRTQIAARRAANPALAARPWPQPPAPRGPRIANDLNAAGVRATLYAWPKNTPLKQDLGAALIAEQRGK